MPVVLQPSVPVIVGTTTLQAEIARRQAAEARVRELEAVVMHLQQRIAILEGGSQPPRKPSPRRTAKVTPPPPKAPEPPTEDPIDRAICEYLERNPDFPVSIQKVAHNYYVFGDRGTVYATQRGDHIVVRVGGGYKSLQVFMDERALMVTGEAAGALANKGQAS